MSRLAAGPRQQDVHALFLLQWRDLPQLLACHGEHSVDALDRQLLLLVNRNVHKRDPVALLNVHVVSFVSRLERSAHALRIANRLLRLSSAAVFELEQRRVSLPITVRLALQAAGEEPLAWVQRAYRAKALQPQARGFAQVA